MESFFHHLKNYCFQEAAKQKVKEEEPRRKRMLLGQALEALQNQRNKRENLSWEEVHYGRLFDHRMTQ